MRVTAAQVVRAALAAVLALSAAAVTPPASIATPAAIGRLDGPDRYATAAAISAATVAPGVAVAFVATGTTFPDSLAAGSPAGRLGAPILLTDPGRLPAATRQELRRLAPGSIVILGGPAAVSGAVEAELAALTAGAVDRIAGADRYATAARISRRHFDPRAPVAYVATGLAFPDALAAGAAAAREGGPVLLVRGGTIPGSVRRELERLRPGRIVVVGGPAVIGDAVLRALRSYTDGAVVRRSGSDRYETAAEVSAATFPRDRGRPVHLASGLGFADAVAGVPAAVAARGPLLLTDPHRLPRATAAELRRLDPERVVLLGGTASIGPELPRAVRSATAWARVGPHEFVVDGHALRYVTDDLLAFNGSTLIELYGTRDAEGAFIYRASDGRWYDHPVGQAQYVVNMLRNHRLDPDPIYLDLALANANRLLERAVRHDGALFFPYPFDWGLHGRGTLAAPWYSGMAQGIALAGFVRLHELTGEGRWLDAAHDTFASFLVPRREGRPWVVAVDDGLLWLEEYPWQPYDHTFNGHNFAIWGLYDYWRVTGSRDAEELALGAITTSARVASRVRTPGGISHYCIADSCLARRVRNPDYHLTHIGQFVQLHRYTRSEIFGRLADTFTADNPDFRRGGTVIFASGDHVGYAFDADGVGSPERRLELDGRSRAAYASRTVPYGWLRPGNGIWFAMEDGALAGTWVRESRRAFARGYVDRLEYGWYRELTVGAGTLTAYRFDGEGREIARKRVKTGPTTWMYSARARINGEPSVHLTSGPLAGHWLPVAATTATTLTIGAFEIPDAGNVPTQRGTTVAPPPLPVPPHVPGIEPPMPGQQELVPEDGPPSGEVLHDRGPP